MALNNNEDDNDIPPSNPPPLPPITDSYSNRRTESMSSFHSIDLKDDHPEINQNGQHNDKQNVLQLDR